MKVFVRVLISATALLSVATVYAQDNAGGADANGRFEGIAASENAIWVVDTRTGRVRKCTQDFADQTPRCSALSD